MAAAGKRMGAVAGQTREEQQTEHILQRQRDVAGGGREK